MSRKGGLGGLWSDRENPRRYPFAPPKQEKRVQASGQQVSAAPESSAWPVATGPAVPKEWIHSAHYTVVLYSHIDAADTQTVGRTPAYGQYQLWTRSGQGYRGKITYPDVPGYEEAEYRILISALTDLLARIERRGRDPAHYTLDVYSRCKPVIEQLRRPRSLNYVVLRPLHIQARTLLKRFDRAALICKQDDAIERLLRL